MTWWLANGKTLAIGAVALGLIAGAACFYFKGERAGSAAVKDAVQTETIRRLDDARISKERTDEEVRRTPYDDRVDGLR